MKKVLSFLLICSIVITQNLTVLATNPVVQDDVPVDLGVQKETPVDSVVQEDMPADLGVQKETPVDSVAQEDMPVDSGVQKETPVDSVAQEDMPADLGVQKETPVDSVAQEDMPVDLGVQKETPVDSAVPKKKAVDFESTVLTANSVVQGDMSINSVEQEDMLIDSVIQDDTPADFKSNAGSDKSSAIVLRDPSKMNRKRSTELKEAKDFNHSDMPSKWEIAKNIAKYFGKSFIGDVKSYIMFYPLFKLAQVITFFAVFLPSYALYKKTGIDLPAKVSSIFTKNESLNIIGQTLYNVIPLALASFMFKWGKDLYQYARS